jgi:hypothetical protein
VKLRETIVRFRDRFLKKLGPQQFIVVHAFSATNAISGQERTFKPGERLYTLLGQTEQTVTIEANNVFFLVERSVFRACCRFDNLGATAFF